MYSTPSIYLDYVHKSDLIWTIKTDDFLPNADDPYDFWTGTVNGVIINIRQHEARVVLTLSLFGLHKA